MLGLRDNYDWQAHAATICTKGISLEGLLVRLIGSITDAEVRSYFFNDFNTKNLAIKIDNLKQEVTELLGADLAALDLISLLQS
jgi:hypothetical protein